MMFAVVGAQAFSNHSALLTTKRRSYGISVRGLHLNVSKIEAAAASTQYMFHLAASEKEEEGTRRFMTELVVLQRVLARSTGYPMPVPSL